VDVVRWFGAMQAQDYLASLWAVGARMRSATERLVEEAIADAAIVRTWPMRGTLHLVAAQDVRWMLALLAPRVLRGSAGRYRQLELEGPVLARCASLIETALGGGKRLTREQLYGVLERDGIEARGARGLHIIGHLALQGLICHGPRAEKQPTFALLDEWVPEGRELSAQEALAELALRYFRSHGPATAPDFSWWSGLPLGEARKGIHLAGDALDSFELGGRRFWGCGVEPGPRTAGPAAYLLPFFDEYTVGYRDRSDVLDAEHTRKVAAGGMLRPIVVIDGRVVGTWRRELRGNRVRVALEPFAPPTPGQVDALREEAARYARFLDRVLELG
jgi:hypothetical protein